MLPASGNISTKLSTIYSPSKTGHIINIKFNNTESTSWILGLYLYEIKSRNSTLIYRYEITAGSMINDLTEYIIPPGFVLQAKSNVNTVVYVINGVE